MKTVNLKIYEFKELSKTVQEKVIKEFQQNNTFDALDFLMEERLDDLLLSSKFKANTTQLFYSLSYCQGDGAMFEFSGTYTHNKKTYNIKIKNSGRYCHEYSADFDITDENYEDLDDNKTNSKIEEKIKKEYREICKNLAHDGYSFMAEENSEESIITRIEDDNLFFTIDGREYKDDTLK